MSSRRKTVNRNLPDLPSDEEVIAAVKAIVAEHQESPSILKQLTGASANEVAHRLRIKGATRHGNGAVEHSWTGTMSPALRLAPKLQSLAKRGQLEREYDNENYRNTYWPIEAGDDGKGAR